MRKLLILFVSIFLPLTFVAQTTIYSNNFTAGNTGWSLGQGGNFDTWIVNNNYSCASTTPNQGGGNYMHIYDDLGGDFCAHCGFYGSGSSGVVYATMNAPIVTTGFSNIIISFDWLCLGQTGPILSSYGTVDYSINGGSNWVNITSPLTKYDGQSTWTTATITSTAVPALANQADLRIRFGFTNSGYGTNPAYSIDNIVITTGGGTSISENNFSNQINVFPNPSKGIFSINFPTYRDEVIIDIIDGIGNKVKSVCEKSINGKVDLDLSSFSGGVYFAKITGGQESAVRKIVIQE